MKGLGGHCPPLCMLKNALHGVRRLLRLMKMEWSQQGFSIEHQQLLGLSPGYIQLWSHIASVALVVADILMAFC